MKLHIHSVIWLTLVVAITVQGFSTPSPSISRKSNTPLPPTNLLHPRTTLPATSGGGEDNGDGGLLSSIPLPTLTQVLSAWLVAIAGNRLVQAIPQIAEGNGNLLNLAVNGAMFAGGLFTLIQTFVGVDYAKLEGLDTKSWAQEAGKFALEGVVPNEFTAPDGKTYQVATFAGGCFWGTELRYQRQVGVLATAVGYTQGRIDKPNYEQVCSGSTGHTEGIQLIYDPEECPYERLVTILLDSVDPTLLNQVGNDRGTQYRHGIYPHTEEQMEIAQRLLQSRQSRYEKPVVTEIKKSTVFWPAENYHQRYLEKGGQSAEKNCEETVRCYG